LGAVRKNGPEIPAKAGRSLTSEESVSATALPIHAVVKVGTCAIAVVRLVMRDHGSRQSRRVVTMTDARMTDGASRSGGHCP